MQRITKKDQKELLDFVISVAKESGKIALKFQKRLKKSDISLKKNEGLVSKADIEVERVIFKKLKALFPEDLFLGEEDTFKSSKKVSRDLFESDQWLWIIDPIDGTHNFINGLEYFCISIGLYHKGNPILGVVYQPAINRVFCALKGQGAFIIDNNSKRKRLIHSSKNKMKDCLMATGFSSEKGVVIKEEFLQFERIYSKTRGIRRMGSAACDLCYTGLCHFDAFWERNLSAWDVAAAAFICIEAGYQVTSFKGDSFSPFNKSILVANNVIHKKMISFLK